MLHELYSESIGVGIKINMIKSERTIGRVSMTFYLVTALICLGPLLLGPIFTTL